MSRFALSSNADEYRPTGISKSIWEDFKAGIKCLDNAAADIAKAGRLFSDIPETKWEKIVKMAPSPMRRTLEYTRDVGKGILLPQLATASGSYVSRLRAFPVVDQERLLHEPVEVAVRKGNRKDKKMVRVPDMTPEEVKQVFAKNGRKWTQRTVSEQWAWLDLKAKKDAQKSTGAEISRPGRWTVRDGRVFISAAKIEKGLTRADIEGIQRDLNL